MAKHFSDLGVRALKADPAWRREVPIGGGLTVIIQPSGRKSYAVRYKIGRRNRKLTLGSGITLAAARKECAAALYEVAQGRDPCAAKQADKQARRDAAADTLRAVTEEYFRREGGKLRTLDRYRYLSERFVYPSPIADQPIGDIRRSAIIRLLDGIEEASGPVSADRTLAVIRRVMNWHASRSDEFRSPIVRGMARANNKDRARSRILSEVELRAVWKAVEKGSDPFSALIKFLLLTGARRNEAAAMTWAEIDGADWTLPAARNKTKVELTRPLSRAALAVIASPPRIGDSPFVFTLNGKYAFASFAQFAKKLRARSGTAGWTLHDLRRTARSLMARAGVNVDHAERCLGHVLPGVRGVYDRHQYRHEMLHAYEALAAQIERIVYPKANVKPLRGGAAS